ncbi:MAG: hypothetical protein OXF57_00160 [Rhodospirillaceae bacterium]|nr:hypothetical protein [Rhodospirillaceae bacterium]
MHRATALRRGAVSAVASATRLPMRSASSTGWLSWIRNTALPQRFSSAILRALDVAKRIESGICHINAPTVHDETQMPFGGINDDNLPGR